MWPSLVQVFRKFELQRKFQDFRNRNVGSNCGRKSPSGRGLFARRRLASLGLGSLRLEFGASRGQPRGRLFRGRGLSLSRMTPRRRSKSYLSRVDYQRISTQLVFHTWQGPSFARLCQVRHLWAYF